MIECQITGVAQDMNFERGETVTYLLLRLPSGKTVRAAVNQEAAAAVIQMHVRAEGAPAEAVHPDDDEASPPAPPEEAPTPEEGDGTTVFGGDIGPPTPEEQTGVTLAEAEDALVEQTEAAMAQPEPQPRQVPSAGRERPTRGRGKKERAPAPPAHTVPKDDRGYPIVPNAGVNTDDITGSRDRDEEGIGQV